MNRKHLTTTTGWTQITSRYSTYSGRPVWQQRNEFTPDHPNSEVMPKIEDLIDNHDIIEVHCGLYSEDIYEMYALCSDGRTVNYYRKKKGSEHDWRAHENHCILTGRFRDLHFVRHSSIMYDEVNVIMWDHGSVFAEVTVSRTGKTVRLPEVLGSIENSADAQFTAECEASRCGYNIVPSRSETENGPTEP